MKNFLSIFFCLIFAIPVSAQIITGGIEHSVQDARNEVFSTPREIMNYNSVKNNFFDVNYAENQSMLLKGVTELKDRKLAKFSDSSYAVIYYNDMKNAYYYSAEGILTHNEVKTDTNYPYKSYRYTPDGTLVNISLKKSENETFIFTTNGKLLAHWVGKYCYDEKNNVIMTREIFD